jgi:hypothetical protein
LRAKDLIEKVPHSRRYRLAPKGYAICVLFLQFFERSYAPLTAGLLRPSKETHASSSLDRLYQKVVDDLDRLIQQVGLTIAA